MTEKMFSVKLARMLRNFMEPRSETIRRKNGDLEPYGLMDAINYELEHHSQRDEALVERFRLALLEEIGLDTVDELMGDRWVLVGENTRNHPVPERATAD